MYLMYINVQTYTITKKRDLWQCSRILYFNKKSGTCTVAVPLNWLWYCHWF